MPSDKAQETSEDLLDKIRNAEVSDAQEAEEEEIIEEKEETEESEDEEEAEETSEEETETAEEKEEETKPRLFKIVVDGKEEYVTEEQLLQYAQKGRYLERERAKDKREDKGEIDWQKADAEFTERIKKEGFVKTSLDLVRGAIRADRVEIQERRKQGKLMADNAEWGKDPKLREEFFDLISDGSELDDASTKVAVKFWEDAAKKGQAKGAEKQKAKEAARIAKGKETIEDEREAGGEVPTMENFEKLRANPKTTSDDLLKFMRKAGVPMGKDTL